RVSSPAVRITSSHWTPSPHTSKIVEQATATPQAKPRLCHLSCSFVRATLPSPLRCWFGSRPNNSDCFLKLTKRGPAGGAFHPHGFVQDTDIYFAARHPIPISRIRVAFSKRSVGHVVLSSCSILRMQRRYHHVSSASEPR